MSAVSPHGEWLSLIDISGPFLAEPVLKDTFPQGLEEIDASKRKLLRQAYDEWREAQELDDPELDAIHAAWIDLVLRRGLELDEDGAGDVFKARRDLPATLKCDLPERGAVLHPDFAVVNGPQGLQALMLVAAYDPGTPLDEPMKVDGWAASPAERMVELCRAAGVRLGLVTNGERWMFVDAPVGAATSFASWYANLWSQEPKTLQAFVNLLGVRRFFVDQSEQLPALLDESLKLQDEVTDALGEQVSRAVEVLVQSLDRANVDRDYKLLEGVEPSELYEAALTVMMRIVFLLSAEERGLLLMGDERYEANYAISTLRMQLRGDAEEILERRWDAWSRLLAIFRAVYGGIEHEALRLPALGGSLFDPDRYPFLEGRLKDSHWKTDPAAPLPIDNWTVLLLLDAVQLFQGRTLSYRALDVEQIGYVYEGLLERTVVRAKEVTLDLDATKSAKKPWVTLDELEAAAAKSTEAVEELLKERTGSSKSRVTNDLEKKVEDADADKLLTACHGDQALRDRVKPYFHFLRIDRWDYPLVYPVGTFMVTTGTDRRETGTHYTPKSLTEAIVKETLEPVAYVGPAEGKPRDEWKLKSPAELLDLKICDPAMGSGAFLVQVCRWLSERLVEAWGQSEEARNSVTAEGVVVAKRNGYEPLRNDPEERLLTARRLIAERCLYGVDVNPLAVELAKLSIWLVTLAKGRPFGFLDHNLRSGDSLLGIHDLDQLRYLDMKPGKGSSKKLFATNMDDTVKAAIDLRTKLRGQPIRDIRDVELMASLDEEARSILSLPQLVADALVGDNLAAFGSKVDNTSLSILVGDVIAGGNEKVSELTKKAAESLSTDLPARKSVRTPFHWPLEFPEVFERASSGFDAVVGNPPFLGNKYWASALGASFVGYTKLLIGGNPGRADLCALFFRRVYSIVNENGCFGLIGTDSIREGDTRAIGLDFLVDNARIYCATPSLPWPGQANVRVSLVWCSKFYNGISRLNGVKVNNIDGHLDAVVDVRKPEILKSEQRGAKGCDNSKGDALLLAEDDPWFRRLKEVNSPFLHRYVTARDFTDYDFNCPARWAIHILDESLDEINNISPDTYEFLIERVKNLRTADKLKGLPGLEKRWWQFNRPGAKLYKNIRQQRRCIVMPVVSKYVLATLTPTNWVFTNKFIIFEEDRTDLIGLFKASPFKMWVRKYSGSLGGTMSVSLKWGINTFPYPALESARLHDLGEKLDSLSHKITLEEGIGFTELHNRINDEKISNHRISEIRQLFEELDAEYCASYGWDDLQVRHCFDNDLTPTEFTLCGDVKSEIEKRLLDLNQKRAAANKQGKML